MPFERQARHETWSNEKAMFDAPTIDSKATRLISSPYPDPSNHLDLSTLDEASRLFAFALTQLRPLRIDYATAPYGEAFNWLEVLDVLAEMCRGRRYQWTERHFYVVVFRSKLREDIDRHWLGQLDQRSHEEACTSGGLLKYWFGTPDAERRNLATCLWTDREAAAAGGRGPWHKQARVAANELYEFIDFHTYKLSIEAGVSGWRLDTSG